MVAYFAVHNDTCAHIEFIVLTEPACAEKERACNVNPKCIGKSCYKAACQCYCYKYQKEWFLAIAVGQEARHVGGGEGPQIGKIEGLQRVHVVIGHFGGTVHRDILEGKGSDYGLVKVTTCAVSGQLATEACEHDVMGYGTVTDWWAKGTEPTVYCQMHTAQTVCADSGELASPYCPNTVTRGVITIPMGHPLYKFINTRYGDVLTEYLGGTASSPASVCTLHTSASQTTGGISQETAMRLDDARMLVNAAQVQLSGMDPLDPGYAAIAQAANYLQMLIDSGNPSGNELAAAMGALTQTMAGIY